MGCSIDNYCHRRGGDISCRRVIPRLIVRQPAAAAASGRQRSTTRAEFVERCRTHARCGTMTSRPHVTAAMMDDQPARGQRRRHIIALCTAELIIAWPTRHERGRQREREREREGGESCDRISTGRVTWLSCPAVSLGAAPILLPSSSVLSRSAAAAAAAAAAARRHLHAPRTDAVTSSGARKSGRPTARVVNTGGPGGGGWV